MINYNQISNVCKNFKFSREECKAMVKSIAFQKCKSRKKVKSKLHNCVSPSWELELRPLGVATGNALSVTRV